MSMQNQRDTFCLTWFNWIEFTIDNHWGTLIDKVVSLPSANVLKFANLSYKSNLLSYNKCAASLCAHCFVKLYRSVANLPISYNSSKKLFSKKHLGRHFHLTPPV